jgi:hypothetical protein
MSFNRLSRSASDDCEGEGDENERVFHGRVPLLTVSACPAGGSGAVIKIRECSFADKGHLSRAEHPRFVPLRPMATNFSKPAGDVAVETPRTGAALGPYWTRLSHPLILITRHVCIA